MINEKEKLKEIDLYFITDRDLTKKTILEDVEAAIKAGVKIIQYRDKKAGTKEMIEIATKIKELCQKKDVIFLINDRIDVALSVEADGVHLGHLRFHAFQHGGHEVLILDLIKRRCLEWCFPFREERIPRLHAASDDEGDEDNDKPCSFHDAFLSSVFT